MIEENTAPIASTAGLGSAVANDKTIEETKNNQDEIDGMIETEQQDTNPLNSQKPTEFVPILEGVSEEKRKILERWHNVAYGIEEEKEVKRWYRITGKQSIERLEPLLCSRFKHMGPWGAVDGKHQHQRGVEGEDTPIDLVWETTCEQTWRTRHNSAIVLNKLHNTQILEDKANLAYLQQKISR